MQKLKITGGNPISGTVKPMANKNSILAIIPACVLVDKPVVLSNVPRSSSVRIMLRIFNKLGGKVAYLKDSKVKLDGRTINKYIVDKELAKKERASLMFLGPLLARFKKAEFGDAGGCKLGNRPIDTLIQGLEDMGAVADKENIYKLETKGLKGNNKIWQLEASVTGTENLILAAVKAEGETIIYNSACEPHVQDMCNFLVATGAAISGIGTNRIVVNGVKKLENEVEWEIISDHIDIGGLIVAAAITGGDLIIEKAIPSHMQQILKYMTQLNLKYKIEGENLHILPNQKLECKTNLKGDMDKIPAYPWPVGFPVDLLPQVTVLAAKASGNIRIMQNMYENQFSFVEELKKMRAKLELADTNRIITFGPSDFKGSKVIAPSVIQGAHAVLLAALAARGDTIIENIEPLYRRYPEILETFTKLGAKIELVN